MSPDRYTEGRDDGCDPDCGTWCDIQAHEAADGGGRRIPDPYLLRFQEAEPALGVKIGLIDDTRSPVGQRRDDAVGRARDPARISSAPEDIVRVEVQHVFARHIVRQHRVVHARLPWAYQWSRW